MTLLGRIGRRPARETKEGWWLSMRWHDLLFAHWAVEVRALRELVPGGLEIDTFDGSAWVGVVPFHMTRIRSRWTPPMVGVRAFAEVNLRTYVKHRGRAGVYFLSLDAPNWAAVVAARWVFDLPYHRAEVESRRCGEWVHYRSARGRGGAGFVGKYRGVGEKRRSRPGSLDYFLTERYCLFTENREGELWTARIAHEPWELQEADVEIERNTLAEAMGIELPAARPITHFAEDVQAVAWLPEVA